MRKVLIIARREYQAAVRTRAFFISLALLPVMLGASALVQVLLQRIEDTAIKHLAVIDRTPGQTLRAVIEDKARRRNAAQIFDPETNRQTQSVFDILPTDPSADLPEAIGEQRFQLSEQVRSGELTGFLEIGPDVWQGLPEAEPGSFSTQGDDRAVVRYQSRSPERDAFARWVEEVVNDAIQEQRCRAAGLDEKQARVILRHTPVRTRGLSQRNPRTGVIEDPSLAGQLALFLVPAGLSALMFIMILFGATPLMQGVFEEKMQRIAEVLLGSVRPFELMLGKLIGMVGISLTILAIYLVGALWPIHRLGLMEYVPFDALAWFVVFQALAVLMYGSLFIAIGAACTDPKETVTLSVPVTMLASLPMVALRYVIEEPGSPLVTALSFFPPATPMIMVARQTAPPGVPWWHPLLGVVVMVLTTLLFVWAAGRIFRIGILMQGKGAGLRDLLRWIARG